MNGVPPVTCAFRFIPGVAREGQQTEFKLRQTEGGN